MKVLKTKETLLSYLKSYKKNRTIGFAPTMGALHAGHLQLIKKAKKECDITICSIFINPTQFNNASDLKNYPRTLESDLEKLNQLKCDIVYAPETDDLYIKGEKVKEFNFGTLTQYMEGKYRSGHFNGMATIVEKLFNLIKPTRAYFGQKDLQQLQIVTALAKTINSSIEIIGIPTIREKNGLAKSSRNKNLSAIAKKKATLIYDCLTYCFKNKEKGILELKLFIQNKFNLQKNIKLEYAEFIALDTMKPIEKWQAKNKSAICMAAYIEDIRLIDNIIL